MPTLTWIRAVQDDEQSEGVVGDRTETLVYKVLFAEQSATSLDARKAVQDSVGKPGALVVLSDGSVGQIKRVNVRRDQDHPSLFLALVDCGKPDDPNPGERWDCTFSSTGVPVTETVYEDDNPGDPDAYVSSSHEPFDPAREKTYFHEQITIAFKTKTPPTAIDGCRGKYNDAAFSITIAGLTKSYPQYTLLLRTADYSHSDQDGTTVWSISLSLEYKAAGWRSVRILDAGFDELIDGVRRPILDPVSSMPINTPHFLNGAGRKSDTPVFKTFVNGEATSFTALMAGLH